MPAWVTDPVQKKSDFREEENQKGGFNVVKRPNKIETTSDLIENAL